MDQRTIKITGVESTEKKINLLDDKLKYNFWRTKKDGTPTKAELQFQKFRFIAGDKVEAMVEETPQTFVNEKGKKINFTDRKIAYFLTQDDQNVPTQPITHKTEENASESLLADDKEILARLDKVEERLNKIETEASGETYFPQKDDEGNITVDELPPF